MEIGGGADAHRVGNAGAVSIAGSPCCGRLVQPAPDDWRGSSTKCTKGHEGVNSCGRLVQPAPDDWRGSSTKCTKGHEGVNSGSEGTSLVIRVAGDPDDVREGVRRLTSGAFLTSPSIASRALGDWDAQAPHSPRFGAALRQAQRTVCGRRGDEGK